jgi:hypothetical protein
MAQVNAIYFTALRNGRKKYRITAQKVDFLSKIYCCSYGKNVTNMGTSRIQDGKITALASVFGSPAWRN